MLNVKIIALPLVLAAALSGQTPEPIAEGVFYIVDSATGARRATEKQTATSSASKTRDEARVGGDHSSVRVDAAAKWEIQVQLKPGTNPLKTYGLYHFAISNGDRLFAIEMRGGQGVEAQGHMIRFEAIRTGTTTRISPLEPLTPGEYGLSPTGSNDVYLFGVDGPAATASAPPSVPAPSSADDRIKTLDDLLAKGLITKDDYNQKREQLANAPKPGSFEDRLQKLEALFKKGLLTKDEYEKKRAQILSEM